MGKLLVYYADMMELWVCARATSEKGAAGRCQEKFIPT